ncbi:MAG: hypothetical protein AAB037_07130, partial [Chloroflexota bacterium]
MRGILACLLASCFFGCQRTAHKRFPIGIFGVTSPAHLHLLKKAGFDTVQTYSLDPTILESFAKEARRCGLKLLIFPNRLRQAPSTRTKNWPVDAWYLQDEPDVAKTLPSELMKTSENTRLWDPLRLQAFVVGQGKAAEAYGKIGDIMMLDWYPVPHLALDSVADEIDALVRAIPGGKPVWMVIQAFDWRDEKQRDPKKPRIGRFPDHAEMRFMSYLAVVHGAQGLFYFQLGKAGNRTLFDVPEDWQALRRVAMEMKTMQHVFEQGKIIQVPFPTTDWGLEAKAWSFHGREYVILLNRRKGFLAPMPTELLRSNWR